MPSDKPRRPHRSTLQSLKIAAEQLKRGKDAVYVPPVAAKVKLEPGFTENEKPPEGHGDTDKPKRGRGRPPKVEGLLEKVAGVMQLGITGVDALVHGVAAGVWTADDRLSPQEIAALTNVISDELVRRQPKVAERIAKLGEVQERAALASVIALILLPRLARHAVLPRGISDAIQKAMGRQPAPETARPDEVPYERVDRETRPEGAPPPFEETRTNLAEEPVGPEPTPIRVVVPKTPTSGRPTGMNSISGA